jgi:hypothetical protein
MDRQQRYGDMSTDELVQRLAELKRSLQRFTEGKGLWVIATLVLLLWLGSGLYVVLWGARCRALFRAARCKLSQGYATGCPGPSSHTQVRSAEVGFRTVADTSTERGAKGAPAQCRRKP